MSLWEAIRNTVRDTVDRDHDGTGIDNVLSMYARLGALGGGAALGAAVGTPFGGTGPITGGGVGAAGAYQTQDVVAEHANHYGDEIADFLGVRDMSAPHAAEQQGEIGVEARRALNPGRLGDAGGRAGSTVGMLGAGILGGPLAGLVGAGVGAAGGSVIGTAADRSVEAVSDLYHHFAD
jgi:hypothetical protein